MLDIEKRLVGLNQQLRDVLAHANGVGLQLKLDTSTAQFWLSWPASAAQAGTVHASDNARWQAPSAAGTWLPVALACGGSGVPRDADMNASHAPTDARGAAALVAGLASEMHHSVGGVHYVSPDFQKPLPAREASTACLCLSRRKPKRHNTMRYAMEHIVCTTAVKCERILTRVTAMYRSCQPARHRSPAGGNDDAAAAQHYDSDASNLSGRGASDRELAQYCLCTTCVAATTQHQAPCASGRCGRSLAVAACVSPDCTHHSLARNQAQGP
jgi:hypothetical protein